MKPSSLKIGIPTLLMLMLSVCLICFSLLSFSTAYSDYKLNNKLLERTNAYYNACNEAYETIFLLQSGDIALKNDYYFFISDTESLYVKLNPFDYSDILSWKVVSTVSDNYDEHLNVIP